MELLLDHWAEITLALLAFAKVIVNLLPSDSPARNVFEILDKLVNAIVPDVRKPGEPKPGEKGYVASSDSP